MPGGQLAGNNKHVYEIMHSVFTLSGSFNAKSEFTQASGTMVHRLRSPLFFSAIQRVE
jgi:hypothetical protein